ncbi:hypothetical protein [Mesorhizobium sp. 113-3-3]|uniref:hypothetical protein n=1 Tax=Mesorhizobium sp. 113-3-3 TaxID=2744516 RepID=UPI0019254ADC|nr:hypothetical protein [Mesorhizobium sp. 113-3-3]
MLCPCQATARADRERQRGSSHNCGYAAWRAARAPVPRDKSYVLASRLHDRASEVDHI